MLVWPLPTAWKNNLLRYLVFLVAFSLCTSAFAEGGGFSLCVDTLKAQARDAGLSDTVIDTVLANVKYNPRVIELDRRQPELTETFHDYLTKRVTRQRVEQGRSLMAKHGAFLNELTAKYGIPSQYLIALWGLETNYGAYTGNTPVLDSLATLACDERRSEFFTIELFEALRLVQNDVIGPAQMQGSWAGAMGNMQFMPSTYRQHAIDADGDGHADMWNSMHDTFASVARFLDALGWQRGYRWGREVKLPKDFPYAQANGTNWQPLSAWRDLGVTTTAGKPLPDVSLSAAILLPSGRHGPAFAVYHNFTVITRWNQSQFYALAAGHLADRINGGGNLAVMPPDYPPLRKELVTALQNRLNELGFDAGKVDGILGPVTRTAIQAYQHASGLIADGYPDGKTLATIGIAADGMEVSAQ